MFYSFNLELKEIYLIDCHIKLVFRQYYYTYSKYANLRVPPAPLIWFRIIGVAFDGFSTSNRRRHFLDFSFSIFFIRIERIYRFYSYWSPSKPPLLILSLQLIWKAWVDYVMASSRRNSLVYTNFEKVLQEIFHALCREIIIVNMKNGIFVVGWSVNAETQILGFYTMKVIAGLHLNVTK